MTVANDFIGIYENAISGIICQELIEFFEICHDCGFTKDRQSHDKASKMEKDDDSLFLTDVFQLNSSAKAKLFYDEFLKNGLSLYAQKYAALNDGMSLNIIDFKIQRTKIGGGYHVWHSEVSNRTNMSRLLAFTAYLNDVEEGGETEFLYYHKRVKPKQGTLIIFPAGFTHTHRGNPPLSNTKYIVTGWVEF